MAEKIVVELDVNTSKGVQQVNELNKSVSNTNKEISTVSDSSKQLTSSLDSVSGGAVSAFKNLKSGLTTAVSGFNSLKIAIIGTGIGALIIAILAVKQAFTSSEEGQNKFAKIMAVIGSITGNLTDLLSDLGELIIGVFENPKKAITDFAKLIKDQIVNRFVGLLELIPQLGKAVGLLFQGKFKEAGEVAFNATSKVTTGVENLSKKIGDATQKTKEFILEMQREAKIAQQIAGQRAKADKTDRELIVQRAEADRRVAELREKALDREKYNTKQRIGFLNEASKVEQDVTNKEIQSAILRRNAIVEENKLSKSNKDALNAEEEAKAAVINLETKRLNLQKALTGQISALKQQEKAENQAAFNERKKALEDEQKLKEDAIKKEIEDEKKRAEAIDNLRKSYVQKLEDLEDKTELQKIERQQSRALAELEALNATEEQKVELIKYYESLKTTATKNEEQKRKEDSEKQAEEIVAKEIELEQRKTDAKLKALSDLEMIFGAESAMGRAALIGKQLLAAKELLIDLGVIKSKASKAIATANLDAASSGSAVSTGFAQTLKLGFPAAIPALIGYAASAVGIISSVLAATKKTKSVASSVGGSGGGGVSISQPQTNASQPPAFNVVGASGTNQLADAIGGQSQQPVKAYVVSNDVTTAQSMDRNIVSGASI
jgi:hypothetical protein